MWELLQTAPTALIVILIVTTIVALAGFGHLLWMWRKSGRKTEGKSEAKSPSPNSKPK